MGAVEVHVPEMAGDRPHAHPGQGPHGREPALKPGSNGFHVYAGRLVLLLGAFVLPAGFLRNGAVLKSFLFPALLLLPVAFLNKRLQLGLQLGVLRLVPGDLVLGVHLLGLQTGHKGVVFGVQQLQLFLGGFHGLFGFRHLVPGFRQFFPVLLRILHVLVQLVQQRLVVLGGDLNQPLLQEKVRQAAGIEQDLQGPHRPAAADIHRPQPLAEQVNGLLVLLFRELQLAFQLGDLPIHLVYGGPRVVNLPLGLPDLACKLFLVGQGRALVLLQPVDL